MLRIMTKKDFWDAIDGGYFDTSGWDASRWEAFSIKQMQDAVLLSRIGDAHDLDILEVGGGNSRTLPHLCLRNRCVNADPVEGSGHGPVGIDPYAVPWRHVFRAMGNTTDALPDASFDIVYSISVLEHVPWTELATVFSDMARVLRPGGRMIHLVDSYLEDPEGSNWEPKKRAGMFRDVLTNGAFAPTGDVIDVNNVHFRGVYATNPDLIMHDWNKSAPQMLELRTNAQACSFLLEATRL